MSLPEIIPSSIIVLFSATCRFHISVQQSVPVQIARKDNLNVNATRTRIVRIAGTNTAVSDTQHHIYDANDDAEMVRLLIQDQFFMQHTGGLFPEGLDLSHIHDVLDVACGSGGWVNNMARAYPMKKVMGIDLGIRILMYARAQALIYGLPNVRYRLMDVLKPLDFPDAAFDLANARFLCAFMPPEAWPKLLKECYRVLRPGGIMRLTEGEYGTSSSLAYEQMSALNTRLLKAAGLSFSPDGRHIGIIPCYARCYGKRASSMCSTRRLPLITPWAVMHAISCIKITR